MSHSSKSTIFLNFFLFHSIKSARSSSVIGSNAIFFTTFCDLSPSQNDPILFYLFLFFFLYELIYVAQYWTLNTWLSFYWCQTVRRRKRLDVLVNNHSIFFFLNRFLQYWHVLHLFGTLLFSIPRATSIERFAASTDIQF